jgi:Na+-transporting NADH:ubiquinone oxidoreductase subunit F
MTLVLTASFVVASMSAVLALVIVVIDLIVNNYGEVKIDVNNGARTLTVKGGSSLLTTLGGEGIFIPSSCGGRATCGVCKVRVTSDVGPHLPTEIPFMSEADIKANIRLSCQIKVKTDISISLPEELFAIQRHRARAAEIRDLTHDTKLFRFSLVKPAAMQFKSGQFAQLVIPPYDKVRENTVRAYSFASAPSRPNEVEFIVRLVPGGAATTYLHKHLAEGGELDLVGPMGEFRLHDEDAVMICIAGGSGMAPIRSLLTDMHERNLTKRAIWYFFGAVSQRDLFMVEEFRALEAAWPIFHFIPTLSTPKPEDNWQGETGLVTTITKKYLDEKMDKDAPKEAYLCGSPGMIDAAVTVLKTEGIPEEKIYYDKFS